MPLMPAERRPTGPGRGRRAAAARALLLALVVALAAAPAGAEDDVVAPLEPAGAPPPSSDSDPPPDTDDAEPRREADPAPRRPRARVSRDVRYLGWRWPTLDIHRPEPGRGRAPAVLLVHGGAWSGGDKLALQRTARTLAAAGFVAVNVNYTLAGPGRPGFPTQVNELRGAVRWVRRRARSLGVDPQRIGALGSSAGAHLVSLLATTGRGPITRGSRVGAVVAWSPPTDLVRLGRYNLRGKIAGFLGCRPCPRRGAAASPVSHVSPDDPPMMIVNSRREMIPTSQARRMAARLRWAGVPRQLWVLPGTLHSPRYSPTVLGPTIRFLSRRLR